MRKGIAVTLTVALSAVAAFPALAPGARRPKVKSANVESYFFQPRKIDNLTRHACCVELCTHGRGRPHCNRQERPGSLQLP